MMNQEKKTIAVIGDGWCAMGAIARALQSGNRVIWVAGSGARVFAPLSTLDIGIGLGQGLVKEDSLETQDRGVEAWRTLARFAGLELDEARSGTFLREFRNKAFRPSAWVQSPGFEQKWETRAEFLWAPEHSIAPLVEARFEVTLGEIEECVRAHLLGLASEGDIERIEEVSVLEIRTEKKAAISLVLASGREISADEFLYCDRWSDLRRIKGLPKAMNFAQKRHAVGVLQATFNHDVPLALGVDECFFASLHKEAGEEIERHVWGYFSSDGKRSFWTVCLSAEEAEDNHEIAKKIRRMKSALSKVFCGPTWVPEGFEDFMATVSSDQGEQVRFEESVLFEGGAPLLEPASVSSLENVRFLTDGYGPSYALAQVASHFGVVGSVGSVGPGSPSVDVSNVAQHSQPPRPET